MRLAPLGAELAERLRAEARGMAEAYRDALLDACPAGSVAGIYLKGSAQRPWDSAVDYVPELSDVDVHVRASAAGAAALGSLPRALEVAERALAAFRARFPESVHTPRPQLSLLADLEDQPGYLPSPDGCVETLHGEPYRCGTPSDYAGCAHSDAKRFLDDAAFVRDALPGKVVDRPGRLLWQAVFTLTWRVAPAGPRLLTQLGVDPWEAWSMNRSGVARALAERGQSAVAEAYVGFYSKGWDGFRSGFQDDSAARVALSAVSALFENGAKVVEAARGPAAGA